MSFQQPLWLLALIPVLGGALFLWKARTRLSASLAFPGAKAMGRAASSASHFAARGAPLLLRTLVLSLCVAAMARPLSVSSEAAGLAEGIDILLVLDTSLSMLAEDFEPENRMGAAVASARDFIRGRTADRIGILVFGSAPLLTAPLTLDHAALQEFLDDVRPGMVDEKGTAIGDGIASGVNHLKDTPAKSKVIILLTDGSSNTGLLDPLTAAKLAKTFGIKIYAVGTAQHGIAYATIQDPVYGPRKFQIRDELDEETLLGICAETGGRYFRATNAEQLKEIYKEIDRMEKYEFEKPEFLIKRDLYPWFLLPAALLLAAELLLSRTVWLRVP